MKKGADAFRSIGEVAKLIGVAPHVLRYWETQFSQLKPMKRPDGRRYYRPDDVRLVAGLCTVLRDEGMTIRGARKMLARDRGEDIRARGAARLGDLMTADSGPFEPATPDYPMSDTRVPDAVPAASRPATPAAARGLTNGPAPLLADAADDPIPAEETQDMAAHGPRSRHRRRRAHEGDDALPLFPELDAAGGDAAWLARLAGLAARLRDLPPGTRLSAAPRARLAALRGAIIDLY
ncbi:MerR family transcriptional regulator [Paracoccus salsus]|uniref:MerR family transcriptional regulator n=1 Tax=Paracoccus salsus TaxID=2911061 RepID=UPI001F434DC6|nr:MerR family transcriptional regulator [Paracoccus salsus]MCF3973750.1 MerR family transcriptional regulator [Paracoccus salsus]